MDKKKLAAAGPRSTNLELLRIIAMMLIIMSHYVAHGVTAVSTERFSFNKILLQMTPFGANMGNYLFFLISGYFLVGAKFRFKKLVKLLLKVFLYSLLGLLVQICVGGAASVQPELILQSLFPVLSGAYWFVSSYVLMYIASPFLNLLVEHMSQKETCLSYFITVLIVKRDSNIYDDDNILLCAVFVDLQLSDCGIHQAVSKQIFI